MLRTYVELQTRIEDFLSDERGGERDTLTTLLILALIIVPLIIVISVFGGDIIQKAEEAWKEVIDSKL